ncbi:MAG: hypothetical protein DRR00_05635 [Candidatus Parabeggiatoa sp. nov. 3]|nr:MAG: hypothetical protein DRR00_05635 [Gammaproteobacteria bacterium]
MTLIIMIYADFIFFDRTLMTLIVRIHADFFKISVNQSFTQKFFARKNFCVKISSICVLSS